MDYLERMYQEPIFGDGYRPSNNDSSPVGSFAAPGNQSAAPARASAATTPRAPAGSAAGGEAPARASRVVGSVLQNRGTQAALAGVVILAADWAAWKITQAMKRSILRRIARKQALVLQHERAVGQNDSQG